MTRPPVAPHVRALLEQIKQLPERWHDCGSFSNLVLEVIAAYAGARPLRRSAETGSGKSTLLLSHLSEEHLVFAVDFGGSITRVRESPIFAPGRTTFIEGPTQLTLPAHRFAGPLQLAIIDGPHAFPYPAMEYYYLYPRLEQDGILILDDINVPTIYQMFEFLKEDAMFSLAEVVGSTAFFRRTGAPTFATDQDDWWLQNFNRMGGRQYRDLALRRSLMDVLATGRSWAETRARVGALAHEVKRRLRRA